MLLWVISSGPRLPIWTLFSNVPRPEPDRHSAPAAATTKKATAPMASDPLRPLRWKPDRPELTTCSAKSPAATAPPVTTAAPHGAPDMAAPDTDISSRRERSC